MGKTRGPYEAEYPAGSMVRVVSREALDEFVRRWKWHHPLQPDQLTYSDQVAKVKTVTYYHGGDELYHLENIPGVWHEENLIPE